MASWPVEWFLGRPCPLCRQPLPPGELTIQACAVCASSLGLPKQGVRGISPLPWWAAGYYQGAYRRVLLSLRHRPRPERVTALLRGMEPPSFPSEVSPLLVPVPSWKRRANPLPPLICQVGGRQWRWASANLLLRSRPVLGQHHLNRSMRQENQKGAFTCSRRAKRWEARQHPLVLVDDILTSGATALSAAETLRQAGWDVTGLICLARTPGERQAISGDLRSSGVQGDTPG